MVNKPMGFQTMASKSPYDFQTQNAAGQRGETYLDRFFSRIYVIEPATRDQQRREIDRWFTNRKTGNRITVEYKTDSLAGLTGNAFVEITSDKERQKPGWAYSSDADFLLYYVPDPDAIYAIRFADLRQRLWTWESRYPLKAVANHAPATNSRWTTEGLLVPLHEFERCAVWVY